MNYEIENNLDWKALLKNQDKNQDKNEDNDIEYNNNICLISSQPLTNGFITLPCQHKFNYINIYNEIINQKQKFSYLEINKLQINQIKCPYCRTIHNNLLPYYKLENIKRIIGVNSPEKFSLKLHNCEYIYNSGKKKGSCCGLSAFKIDKKFYCNKHQNFFINYNIDENSKDFYKKYTIPQLKEILSNNNCKIGGNKTALIERILLEKNKKLDQWIKK